MRSGPVPSTRMLRSLLLAFGLGGCVGRTMTTSLSAASPRPAPDIFACAREQLKALGFAQSSLDAAENRVEAKQYDESVRRPDVNFRRLVDRLEVKAAPGAGGAISDLTVTARTLAEFTTQRGPTEVQERTSPRAAASAQTIIDKCRQPVDSMAVPE
jgi:hypothetical protein